MDNKTRGMALGVAGVILWFMPLVYVKLDGFSLVFQSVQMHQAGHHIGGIAYLLILSSAIFAVSSWFLSKQISIFAASISTGISVVFLFQAGSSAAWGLICLVIVSVISLVQAFEMPINHSAFEA